MQPGVLEEPAPTVNERNLIASFEENRKAGRGHFLTRDEVAKIGSRRLSDVLNRIPGAPVMRGRSNAAFPGVAFNRGKSTNAVAAGVYCPDDSESRSGIQCGCYTQVYVNNMLVNRGNPTPPFDINTVPAEQLEALEYYRSAAETPPKYSGSAAQCGILVLWTKRSL
jgi:hypothetical protein